mmetsp:Transcript_91177/g.162352  ORF Transcript_91177/g.162352 Transcript_91177/m.162352 type:complete len:457 (+) Transcript_91177:92-1462(+)
MLRRTNLFFVLRTWLLALVVVVLSALGRARWPHYREGHGLRRHSNPSLRAVVSSPLEEVWTADCSSLSFCFAILAGHAFQQVLAVLAVTIATAVVAATLTTATFPASPTQRKMQPIRSERSPRARPLPRLSQAETWPKDLDDKLRVPGPSHSPEVERSTRVPEGSILSTGLQNGHLAATFARVEPMASGRGAVGATGLFQALHQLEGAWYALKMVTMHLRDNEEISERQELQEVRSLRALADSRHVVRYVTAWCEELSDVQGTLGAEGLRHLQGLQGEAFARPSEARHTVVLFVQTELCHGTNLREWLDSRTRSTAIRPSMRAELLFADELHFVEQLSKATREVHRAGLVHRDIQPESLFVVKGATLKVGNFSAARPASASQNEASDIASMGLVCLELLCSLCGLGRKAGEVPKALEELLPGHAALVSRMIAAVPTDRPTAAEVHSELKRLRNIQS